MIQSVSVTDVRCLVRLLIGVGGGKPSQSLAPRRPIHVVPALRARGLSARDGPLACSAASRLSPEKRLSLLGVERSLVAMRAGDVVPVLCARGCADDAAPVLCARGLSTRDGPLACLRLST